MHLKRKCDNKSELWDEINLSNNRACARADDVIVDIAKTHTQLLEKTRAKCENECNELNDI